MGNAFGKLSSAAAIAALAMVAGQLAAGGVAAAAPLAAGGGGGGPATPSGLSAVTYNRLTATYSGTWQESETATYTELKEYTTYALSFHYTQTQTVNTTIYGQPIITESLKITDGTESLSGTYVPQDNCTATVTAAPVKPPPWPIFFRLLQLDSGVVTASPYLPGELDMTSDGSGVCSDVFPDDDDDSAQWTTAVNPTFSFPASDVTATKQYPVKFSGSDTDQGIVESVKVNATNTVTASLSSTTPKIAVVAVRFAALAASDAKTPGLPVIKDDGVKPGGVMDHQWGPSSCAGLGAPKDYDWLNCSPGGTGAADKDWPVIYAAGQKRPEVNEVVLVSPSQLAGSLLSAKAKLGAKELELAPVPLVSAKVGGEYQLSAKNLTFSGQLPAGPGVDKLAITWTVIVNGDKIPAGTSSSQIYVTAGSYVQPGGISDQIPPYVSVLDVGTRPAAGHTGLKAIFDAIWQQFRSLHIQHPILNPKTGEVAKGPLFDYYGNGWATIADWWNHSPGSCLTLLAFIAHNSGHCRSWAEFLAAILAYQGIHATYVTLGTASGFYAGPAPSGHNARYYSFMLVGPGLWKFTHPDSSGSYPYTDSLGIDSDKHVVIYGQSVTYTPSHKAIAQGGVRLPPPMFNTGDHAIVQITGLGYADPSYGNPDKTTLFQQIKDQSYEKSAIAGFAVVYYRDGSDWDPLLLTEDVRKVCASHLCEFRAVPYGQTAGT